jgi:hypothetical protein
MPGRRLCASPSRVTSINSEEKSDKEFFFELFNYLAVQSVRLFEGIFCIDKNAIFYNMYDQGILC